MKRSYRLSGAGLKVLLRAGRRIDALILRLVYRKNNVSRLRLALIVPRAVDKRSTKRNRIRRRAREWVRVQPELAGLPIDAALIFKKGSADAGRRGLKQELTRVFGHIPGAAMRL